MTRLWMPLEENFQDSLRVNTTIVSTEYANIQMHYESENKKLTSRNEFQPLDIFPLLNFCTVLSAASTLNTEVMSYSFIVRVSISEKKKIYTK